MSLTESLLFWSGPLPKPALKASPKQHWKTMLLKATRRLNMAPFGSPLGTPGGNKFEQEAPTLRTWGPMGAKWIPNGRPDPQKANCGSEFEHCGAIFYAPGMQFVTFWCATFSQSYTETGSIYEGARWREGRRQLDINK